MAKIKISQLPAKAANLAATDLLEVSEVSGLTYVSKKITGAELVGNRVPYTGATSDVDLGEYELKAGQIELDQSPTGTAGVAVTRWNDSIGLTETTLKGGSVIIKNGVDLVARVVNKVTPNTTLTKAAYPVVKISGAQGQRLAVDYAQANNDNNSADTLGVVTETIATNQEGFIMTVGQLDGINTTGSLQGETWLDGDVLYLSPTVPGAVTKVKPTGATGHIVVIGYVEHAHNVNGKIYVKIMNGWELDELHNVYIDNGTLANNQVLTYESATQLWKNKTPETGITVGTTSSTGTNGRVFFQAGGVVQQDANFTFDNTLKRLTLKAVGTAATDIPLVVRNSADTNDLINVAGDTITLRATSAPMVFNQGSAAGVGQGFNFTNTLSTIKLLCGNSGDGTINSTIGQLVLQSRGTANQLVVINNIGNNSVNLGHSSAGSGTNKITLINGIAPTTNLTDIFQLYSADRGGVAGKASAHFRAEDGTINVIGDLSGFGTSSPGARLDVIAQGALSTDIAFRVRNSADSSDIFSVRGNGDMYIPQGGFNSQSIIYMANTTDTILRYSSAANSSIALGQNASITSATNYNTVIGGSSSTGASTGFGTILGWGNQVNASYGIVIGNQTRTNGTDTIKIGNDGGASSYGGTNSIHIGKSVSGNNITADNVFMTYFASQLQSTVIRSNGSLGLFGQQNQLISNGTGANGLTTFMGDGGNTLVVRNHTSIPSLNITDSFQLYSNDITAGNAAPHFRTESGDVIKLYKNAAVTTPQGIADALTNLGVLTASTIAPSVQSVVSAATVTPVNGNDLVKITAQAAALTLANPTGVWPEGKDLMIRIKDDGLGARAITWDTNYRAIGVTLPTTTVLGKTTYVGIIYNSTDGKWDVIGVTTEA